jgi:hypothetical protein
MRLELQASVQELDEIRSFSDWNCKLSVPHPPPPTIAGSDFACFLSFQGI